MVTQSNLFRSGTVHVTSEPQTGQVTLTRLAAETQTRCSALLFGVLFRVFIAAAIFVVGFTSSTAAQSTACLSGTWQGTFADSAGEFGALTASLNQIGTSFTGTVTINYNLTGEAFTSQVTGTVQNSVLTFGPLQLVPGGQTDSGTGTISSTCSSIIGNFVSSEGHVVGSYQITRLQITTASLPGGQVGVNYDSGALSATGGRPFPPVSFSYSYTWSATTGTGLPFGLHINYFTGDISGLPSVAQTYSPVVTVTDFNGTTARKTFQIVIASNPKLSVDTVVQNSYYSMLADYWFKIASIDYQAANACTVFAPEMPELGPLCLGLFLKAAATVRLAELYEAKAADPADTNYMEVALPNPPSLTIPAPDPSWTAAQLAAYNALVAVILTEEQIIGLSNAEMTAVNRAGGANQAGNTYWVQQQLAAQKQYSEREAFDLNLFVLQSSQLKAAYAASGFQDFSVSVADATTFELGIAAKGLPSDLLAQLAILGIDAEGLSLVQEALPSFDPSTVSADTLQSFVPPSDVSATIQQLAASFITSFSVFDPKVDVFECPIKNSTLYAFRLVAPFSLGSANGDFNPTVQDVSFNLGTFAITVPAGSFRGSRGYYEYVGTVNGVGLIASISPTSTGHQLRIDGLGVSRTALPNVANPMAVGVQIGNAGGSTTITASNHSCE